MTDTTTAHDKAALALLESTRPQWSGLTRARDVVGAGQTLRHAGPPFESWEAVPRPVRNSLALACVYEGWAGDVDSAFEALATGSVALAPAQDHDLVVPLAGVISPSMVLHRISDAASSRVKYAVLNEGLEHCLRVGAPDEEIPAFQGWLNGRYADWLASRLTEPIPLLPILDDSLARGDDGHSRTLAGSELFTERLVNASTPPDIADFQRGCGAFALNLWMGAAALILAAAEGAAGSRLVTRAGGNGVDFGIQFADEPGRWHTAPAGAPRGPVDPAHTGHGAVGAIGDSAVVDVLGLGGQALRHAPVVVTALAGHLPEDALHRPDLLLPGFHPEAPRLRIGLSAHTVASNATAPLVLLGMISDSGRGRIGGGVYEPPVALFREGTATSPS